MIKLIAFDLVGVLVTEKSIILTPKEEYLERLFGPNKSDLDYIKKGKKIINEESLLIKTTKDIIDKIYQIKDKDIFKKIKQINNKLKIIIATNHISFVKKFIENNMDLNNLDEIIISSEINKIKPNKEFYKYILEKYKIKPEEMLFLDDNNLNIESAEKMGINTIKVNPNTDILSQILVKIYN